VQQDGQQNTFKQGERLKSRKLIGRLFGEGHSFGAYPLRLVWLELDNAYSDFPVQFTVSVPKRRYKLAVTRNRLKRRVREAWRLRKTELYPQLPPEKAQLAFMVIYTGKEEFTYQEIDRAMQKMIRKFTKQYLSR